MAKATNIAGRAGSAILAALRSYGWILILAGIAVLTVSAIASKERGTIETIRTVIEPLPNGELLVTEEQVIAYLSESFTKPMDELTLSDIDIERVETILKRQAFVRNAEAFVDADLHLNLTITQRKPLLRIMSLEGQNYFFDEQGERMPLSEEFTPRLRVATGHVLPWTDGLAEEPDHQLNQLVALARLLCDDPFLDALIEQIYVSERGELQLAPKVGDQVILLGNYDPEQTPERLRRLKTFYREGLPYEGWRKYRAFDLRYADQVVAKKR